VKRLTRRRAAALISLALYLTPSHASAGYLDTTIAVDETSAAVGGVFHVHGQSSCQLTDVALRAYNYDGEYKVTYEAATTTFDEGSRLYNYKIAYNVPYFTRPGDAALFADTRCGDPNAKASPDVAVKITTAAARLTLSPNPVEPGKRLQVQGTDCYGDADGVVHATARSSNGITRLAADLKQQSFTAAYPVPVRATGKISVTTDASDCAGSTPARAEAAVRSTAMRSAGPAPAIAVTEAAATPSRAAATPAAATAASAAPSHMAPASARPTRMSSAPAASQPTPLGSGREDGGASRDIWLIVVGIAATTGAVGTVMARTRRR
jgi:hypothetical protein